MGNKMEEILKSFLEYAINTQRISGDHDGLAGCTMVDDSYEKIAKDFIKEELENQNGK